MTYTYAILEVSRSAYLEILRLLKEAGHPGLPTKEQDVIDLHGLALRIRKEQQDCVCGDPHSMHRPGCLVCSCQRFEAA